MQVVEIVDVRYEKGNVGSSIIPSGTYQGMLSGYGVVFKAPGFTYIKCKTDYGVRGINIPCSVSVNSSTIRVTY